MNKAIDDVRRTRTYLLSLIDDLSIEQLNIIPTGLNNNIIWHLGHLVATQQRLCYSRAGKKMFIDERLTSSYMPGTKPENFIEEPEIKEIKYLLLSSINQFENDYKHGLFSNYESWTTQRYGAINISTIDDAMQFLLYHEGLHAGCIMTQKNILKK